LFLNSRFQKDIKKEGIFRIPARYNDILEYKDAFEDGQTDLSHCKDPFILAGLVCLFIRELPEPLLTYELYDRWTVDVFETDQAARDELLKSLLAQVPATNYNILRAIFIFLRRVHDLSIFNKMNAKNLGLIFGTTLLKPLQEGGPQEYARKILKQSQIVEFLIISCTYIFQVDEKEYLPLNPDRYNPNYDPNAPPTDDENSMLATTTTIPNRKYSAPPTLSSQDADSTFNVTV